ncbi:MAG: hypothetical protein CSA29_02640 [Desulfobacterales bacterium]|nr:MAG: hypothetical protein CSA29_02640 [Desulfobacterales bacterium]
MYFKITYSSIYNWKGTGTQIEQRDPDLVDSFCHLIIAKEATTEETWLLLVDQGEGAGVATTDCISYIIPRICEEFLLDISKIRAFEIWPYHTEDPRLKYTEIVISDVTFDLGGNWVLHNSWQPAAQQDTQIIAQLVDTVGDKVILNSF